MTPTFEERQRALDVFYRSALYRHTDHRYPSDEECEDARDVLRDCIAIPRSEWENYRKALWVGMEDSGYPDIDFAGCFNEQIAATIFADAGLIGLDGKWTPAAHALAKEMQGK